MTVDSTSVRKRFQWFNEICNSCANRAMPMIAFEEGAVWLDARTVAKGLGIDPSLVQTRMH